MPRVKRGKISRKRHKKLLKATRGFGQGRKNLVKVARQASLRAMHNAYRDRKVKKRLFRSLWIIRINAALRTLDISYSKFINLAKKANLTLNRKVLSNLAVNYPDQFKDFVEKIKSQSSK